MFRAVTAGLIGLSVLTAVIGCSPLSRDRTVSVLATWTGTEGDNFEKVLDAFTEKTGIRYEYTGTRALDEALQSNLQRGTPPHIAILSSTGDLARYARSGDLAPLSKVIPSALQHEYSRPWLLPLNGEIYTIPIKVSLKSIIWYNPSRFSAPAPRSWGELLIRSRAIADQNQAPWCMGMRATRSSGWPGTDWIEDILLHQTSPETYRRWAAGLLAWTSPEVENAWKTWGEVVSTPGFVHEGRMAALLTDFTDAGRAMFTDPPGCFLEHQASFITDTYRSVGNTDDGAPEAGKKLPASEKNFDFFPFPSFGQNGGDPARQPVAVSADLAGMFNNTPEAQELIKFLASEEAQRNWPGRRDGGAFSVHRKVSVDAHHPDDRIGRRIAEVLGSAATVCMDASDLMAPAVRDAFSGAVLEYLSNPDPTRLSTLLTDLDKVQVQSNPTAQEQEELRELSCTE
ncbi:ABC transporter substrate-binding protein [Streptosporangium sp. 'caverna']|uniref:ABC transporter substrate-binding protein n=1 Tax=Streptosporangium sp. 'caverna' TaxID=2202249 RepID=UPI000D7D7125|nr:ABC transporter substrate-binding protein [Streptosporangium sp. 'caverna']AWS41659.1 ABC transporter substrate-binding protein [Streptosporangium sp. 'caverna']